MKLDMTKPHSHHTTLIVTGILLIVVVIGAIVFQSKMNREKNARDLALWNEYQAEQVKQSADFFATIADTPITPMTEQEKIDLQKFFEQNAPQPQSEAELRATFTEQQKLSEQAFIEWKSARNQP